MLRRRGYSFDFLPSRLTAAQIREGAIQYDVTWLRSDWLFMQLPVPTESVCRSTVDRSNHQLALLLEKTHTFRVVKLSDNLITITNI